MPIMPSDTAASPSVSVSFTQSSTFFLSTGFGVDVVTFSTSFSTISGWFSVRYWAIIPPWELPMTGTFSRPRALAPSYTSSARNSSVITSGSGSLRSMT